MHPRSAWLRAAAYLWASPVSLLGLFLALPAGIGWGQARMRDGLLEVTGGLAGWLLTCRLPGSGPVAALALGHVLVGRSAAELAAMAPHERVHVAQAERWGALFLLAYPLASLGAWARGGHPYLDNVFEQQARRIAGY